MGKLKPLTDEEEARIQAQIAADPDNYESTDEELAQAKPMAEAFDRREAEEAYQVSGKGGGVISEY